MSPTMKQLLAEAVAEFDWVIIDTPPVGLMPDANLLAGMIDSALLVVSAKTTPYPLARRAMEAIGPSKMMGVVFNRTEKQVLGGEVQRLLRVRRALRAVRIAVADVSWHLALSRVDRRRIGADYGRHRRSELSPSWRRLIGDVWEGAGIVRILLIVVVCQVCLHYADLYELRATSDARDLLVRLFQASERRRLSWRSCTSGFRTG